jgi:EpsI family protein
MTIKRLASLQIFLLGGLGSVFLIPKEIKIEPAAIDLSLPEYVGNWHGVDQEIGKNERDILGPDTQLARKAYALGTDQIFVSIVLSGPDMNTSIHRPERCLPAQGWTVADSKTVAVPLEQGAFRATRLQNIQNVPANDGRRLTLRSLNYYWFVGHLDVTPSHMKRNWIDIRDRVLTGRNQQWAYVTVGSTITKDYKVFGRDERQTDEQIQSFIRQLMPQLQKPATSSHE